MVEKWSKRKTPSFRVEKWHNYMIVLPPLGFPKLFIVCLHFGMIYGMGRHPKYGTSLKGNIIVNLS